MIHQPNKISTCSRPKSQQWVCNIFKISLAAENYKPHTQLHPKKKMISAKKIFINTKSQKGYLMPWAKWKTHGVSSYIILAVAKGQSQMQNCNFKTTREVSSHILPKSQRPTANAKPQLLPKTQTLAPTPTSPLMTWNDDAMWTLVYVVYMHVCVKTSMS